MNRALVFWRSVIGKKVVMAVTGIIGIAFLITHVAANLLAYRGPAAINAYSHFLHSTGELLWVARVVLLAAVILHVIAAWQLTQMNHAARTVQYAVKTPQQATLASRLMRWGGVLLLVFIVFHILHFTTGTFHPGGPYVEGDVFANVVTAFHVWWVSLFYLIAMVFLGLHLYHGGWSSVRSLGITGTPQDPFKRTVAGTIAVLIWLGFSLVPLGVLLGWVR